MSVTITGFTRTSSSPFITFESNKYYNGIITDLSNNNYYYSDTTNTNTDLYVFQRYGDTSTASGTITINTSANVEYYLIGGGGGGGG